MSLSVELIKYAGDIKVWAFFGEMGAGKTTFIRAICETLGVKHIVSSPTFSIINEYEDRNGDNIFHFDFFRIEKEKEAVEIGCEEYFESGSLCLIEWPEKILNLVPHPFIRITINIEEKERRFIFAHD